MLNICVVQSYCSLKNLASMLRICAAQIYIYTAYLKIQILFSVVQSIVLLNCSSLTFVQDFYIYLIKFKNILLCYMLYSCLPLELLACFRIQLTV